MQPQPQFQRQVRSLLMLAVGPFLLLTLALTGPILSRSGFGMAVGGMGYDPLTEAEEARIVTSLLGAERAVAQQEVLLVERHEDGKESYRRGQWERRGDIYVYDYGTDSLRYAVVDVATGQVLSQEEVKGVQLPLTVDEVARVLSIVDEDAALRTKLQEQYRRIAGQELTNLEQLQHKVSVFRADAMPDRVAGEAQLCGLRRCAQVLLFTANHVAFEVLPIVDLSHGRVLQVIEAQP